jgi:hypothetical protein
MNESRRVPSILDVGNLESLFIFSSPVVWLQDSWWCPCLF